MKKLKTSILSRSTQLIGVASRIAGHELTQKIKGQLAKSVEEHAPEILKTRIKQAQILAENLSQLKGAAMKFGQLLSIDSTDLIPPEVLEVLSQLQSQSDPLEYSQIRPVLEKEIPVTLRDQMAIEEKAFSAASIGQVHKAQWKNQNLALKIQYPGIRETIDSDLAILKKTVSTFLTVSQRSIQIDDVFSEMSKILHQETDYLREQALMEKYRQKIESSALKNRCIVPQSISEISTKNVLAMSFEPGLSLKQWLETSPSLADRRLIGSTILELYCYEFFQWGLVQTDPNFGNYLVRDNQKLVLLDFGATQEFTTEFVDNYRQVLKAFAEGNEEKILQASYDFKLLDERESAETKNNYVNFMRLTVEPFSPKRQPFSFHDDDYMKRNIDLGRKFTTSLRYSPPPKHIVFLHRKLGGIFNLLRKMQVTLDLTEYWEKMVFSKTN